MTEPSQALTQTTQAAPPAVVVKKEPREQLVTTSSIDLLDTAKFEHMQRVASLMAKMELLPLHLRARPWFYPKKKTESLSPAEEKKWRDELGPEAFDRAWAQAEQRTVANCILVVDQALRWGMNPFATMGETYEIGGKLANQGKLVLAVVNARGGLRQRLRFEFSGENVTNPKQSDRTVTVIGTFKDEDEPRTVDLKVKDAATDNQMWAKDPDQKLIYSGVVRWARRHCPEVVLGVVTDDDMERMLEEASANRAPTSPSSLDAFAAAGALPAGLPSPSQVIDLTGSGGSSPATSSPAAPAAPTPAESAPGVVVEGPGSEDQAAAAGSVQAGPAPAAEVAALRVRLASDKVEKLRALMQAEPVVGEAVVVQGVGGSEGVTLDTLEGNPGEGAQALYTRVLTEIQRLKGK